MQTRTIISFDGNVFAGKTTIIRQLAQKYRIKYLHEHAYFVQVSKKRDPWEIQKRYLASEHKRMKAIPSYKTLLLDRSIFSQCAHVWAMNKIGLNDMRQQFIKELQKQIDRDEVIIPTKNLIVNISYKQALARYRNDNTKNTHSVFIQKNYFCAIDQFNRRLLKKIPGAIVTTTMDVSKIYQQLCKTRSNKLNKEKIKKIIGWLLR